MRKREPHGGNRSRAAGIGAARRESEPPNGNWSRITGIGSTQWELESHNGNVCRMSISQLRGRVVALVALMLEDDRTSAHATDQCLPCGPTEEEKKIAQTRVSARVEHCCGRTVGDGHAMQRCCTHLKDGGLSTAQWRPLTRSDTAPICAGETKSDFSGITLLS